MRGFSPQDASNRNQRVVFPRGRQLFCRQRQFERTRNMHHVHVFALRAATLQRIRGRSEQALGDKAVEAAHDDPKAQTGSAQAPVDLAGLDLLWHFLFVVCAKLSCLLSATSSTSSTSFTFP